MRNALLLCTIVLLAAPLGAQEAAPMRREVNLDVTFIGAAVGYATGTRESRLFGVQLGIGGEFINRTLLGGDHFTKNGGHEIFEVAHLAAFVRLRPARWSSVDVGLRAAGLFHGNDLDDDVAPGLFGGLYVMPMFGNERFSIGPRILAGAFSEPGNVTEFGLNVSPIVGRVTFRP